MKVVAMIPARLEASRFPKKLIQDLNGKTVIERTFQAAVETGLFHEVYVVTDAQEIGSLFNQNQVIYSEKEHETGSDRLAEAAAKIEADVIVNVQGDEPFIDTRSLGLLVDVFKKDADEQIDLASLKTPIEDEAQINNPNVVKVICDQNDFAMYFSRSAIPYNRAQLNGVLHYKHIGVYAFRKDALIEFSKLEIKALEAAEKIEAIRFLEHNRTMKMVTTQIDNVGIDTPEDLERARLKLKAQA
jgi:3-deoxy-manno-octulosonate cytidylyltransferase (CMP-KDO synthetase)